MWEKKGFGLCENEEEWKCIYREREGGCSAILGGNGWEVEFEFYEGRWGYGEEWVDVNGEWGNWEEDLR